MRQKQKSSKQDNEILIYTSPHSLSRSLSQTGWHHILNDPDGKMLDDSLIPVYRVYRIDTRITGDFVNTLEETEASVMKEQIKQ